MNKIKTAIVRFFSDPKCVFALGFLVMMIATTIEVARGRNTNYFDYHDGTMMFWSGILPYTPEFYETRGLYYLYSPVFSVLFTPIFMLPRWLGPFVWNIMNYSLLALSIKTLPGILRPHRLKIFLFLLPVIIQGTFCFQYNLVVCYIFLFAFTLLERGRYFWAVLLIMISATTKIYGAIELALLFCYPHVWRHFGYAILCGATLLLLPAINPAFDNIWSLYVAMYENIANHTSMVDYVGLLFARGLKPFLLPHYRIVQITVIALLGVVFFMKYKRWGDFRFRVQALAVLMGYIILFSDSPETHTYLISLSGYLMAFWIQPQRTTFDWILFWLLFVNFGILPTDVLCPTWLHHFIHDNFWLDVYCMTLAWLRIIWWALRKPNPDESTPATPDTTDASATQGATGASTTQGATGASVVSRMVLATGVLFLLPALLFAQPSSKTFQVKGVSFTMRFVAGGTFMMGALPGDTLADADEVRHQVRVKDYYIGETEVTQELWEAVMEKNRSKHRGNKQFPMENVSYDDCMEFISRLQQLTGQKLRLPTEAEWEYAARGGRHSHQYLYAGSNEPYEVACIPNPGERIIHDAVKQKKPNELGLYDMSGNVWEWCETPYQEYVDPSTNILTCWFRKYFRVIRGGSFRGNTSSIRVTNRYQFYVWRKEHTIGLRLAL